MFILMERSTSAPRRHVIRIPKCLNTSETTEFILDFSTGVITGGWNSSNRDQSGLEVWSFERKSIFILLNTLANKDRRAGIVFRKMMPPGTISLISVPELEELPSVS